ncbi:MAG: hypothetical protein C7B46_16085, partial [Sulfobacillus benefaciens]
MPWNHAIVWRSTAREAARSFHEGVMVERNGGVAQCKMAMAVAFNIRYAAPIPCVERLSMHPIRQTLRSNSRNKD